MTSLEKTIEFYAKLLTKEQIEECKKKAKENSSVLEADYQGIEYEELYDRYLFQYVYEEYMLEYNKRYKYSDRMREGGKI